MLTAPYKRMQATKQTVNTRRINKEWKREQFAKLRLQFFVAVPRLVKHES